MRLWPIERDDRLVGYDEWDAWIVAHHSGDEALDSVYHREKGITFKDVGQALPSAVAGEVILSSFNAG